MSNVRELPPVDDTDDETLEEIIQRLEVLRQPISSDEVEKLPKPTFKDAWKDKPSGRCDQCGGWHCLSNVVHLDYLGHAEVTKRLLEADLFWTWEPLALDPNGLPRYDQFGGLWIKLTVAGVTRLGYGDAVGKQSGTTAVKEIIGDALRNAAMRFGVALDLWSKLDRHDGKNPEEHRGQTPVDRTANGARTGGNRQSVAPDTTPPPRAANQDALDALMDVCNEHGYDTRAVAARWEATNDHPIRQGDPDAIMAYAAILIAELPEPLDDRPDQPGASGGIPPVGDPLDTTDVEKQQGDLF